MKVPTLHFDSRPLSVLLEELVVPGCLVVTDVYNKGKVERVSASVSVWNNKKECWDYLAVRSARERVVAIGGCTALDAGRYLATNECVLIPTILSTSCLSVNRSVLRDGDRYYSQQTVTPTAVYISLPEILNGNPIDYRKWTSSGLGDLFANISAAIERLWEQNKNWQGITVEDVLKKSSMAGEALQWIAKQKSLQRNISTVKRVTRWLHLSSVDVIRAGDARMSAGSEHALYYRLLLDREYPHDLPTHGQLVSIGTLLASYLYANETGNDDLYNLLRRVFQVIGLPLSWVDIRSIGVERKDVVQAIMCVQQRSVFYRVALSGSVEKYLDAIYGPAL